MNTVDQKKISFISNTHLHFVALFAVVFFVTFAGLYTIGLVPSEFESSGYSLFDEVKDTVLAGEPTIVAPSTGTSSAPVFTGESPTHITIPEIGVDATVSDPTTTNVDALDDDLGHGAVHYPGSGLLADGNVYIFGHSTNWSIVHNQAYKTFNDLNNLSVGDEIDVTGQTHVFVYKVTSVRLANDSEIWVDFSGTKPELTLSTCNTFGQKQQRYVVTANYAYSYPIGSPNSTSTASLD